MAESSSTVHSPVEQVENGDSQPCDVTDTEKVDVSITEIADGASHTNGNSTEPSINKSFDDTNGNIEETMISKQSDATCDAVDTSKCTEDTTIADAADTTIATATPAITDAYHYLKRGEYSTENFKLCVKGLKMSNYGRVSEFILDKLGFKPNKIKIARGHIFVAFKCEEDLQKGLVKLRSAEHKGVPLQCERAEARADPFVTAQNENEADSRSKNRTQRKRKGGNRDGANNLKVSKDDPSLSAAERLVSTVCPLAAMPYADQLQIKESEFEEFLKWFTVQLKKQFPGMRWVQDVGSASVCCDVLPIIPSPVEQHYRNKTEFTIGLGGEGKANTVGFRIGHYRDGSNLVVQADDNVLHTAPVVYDVARLFSDYLGNQDLPSYDITTHEGFWKQLMVRGTRAGELMVVAQVKKGNIPTERFAEVIDGIKQHFSTDDRIASVYISHSSTHNNTIDTYTHVSGSERIQEQLHGLTFSISPQAFFQVNTAAAELLYQTVIDWAKRDISESSIILDVCCGTGTIGICAAKQCPDARVVGVDCCKEAIEDAQRNLEQNNVANASFSCGLAEEELSRLISQIKKDEKKDPEIIAIVDPPRAGLHPSVIFTLRNTPQISRIIYVSCSPKQAEQNFFNLCALPNSKKRKGAPFKLVQAVAVDLFPQTNHCEAVLEFERLSFDDLTRPRKSDAQD